MKTFYVKRNDSGRVIQATLGDADTGTPTDLSGCTVVFVMSHATTGTVREGNASVASPASAGVVNYTLSGTDTATAGTLNCEFEVTTAANKKITYPSNGYIRVVVQEDLNP